MGAMPPLDRRIAGRALRFALPLMLADSLESLLWLVDAYFVSLLGEEALAAVGVGGLPWLALVHRVQPLHDWSTRCG